MGHDALCLLPLNIVNEKVYIFLWFWFILLTVLSFLVIVYRFIIVISPKMRAYLLYIRFRLIRREVINTIVKKSYVGDWFLFYMLGELYYQYFNNTVLFWITHLLDGLLSWGVGGGKLTGLFFRGRLDIVTIQLLQN